MVTSAEIIWNKIVTEWSNVTQNALIVTPDIHSDIISNYHELSKQAGHAEIFTKATFHWIWTHDMVAIYVMILQNLGIKTRKMQTEWHNV